MYHHQAKMKRLKYGNSATRGNKSIEWNLQVIMEIEVSQIDFIILLWTFCFGLQYWSDLWSCRMTCIKVMHFSKKENNQIAIRSVPTPAVLSSSPPTVARSLEFLVGSEKPGGCGATGWENVLNAQWGEKHFHFLYYVVECESGTEDGRAALTAQWENLPRGPVLSQWSALDLHPDTFNTSRWYTCSGLQRPISL